MSKTVNEDIHKHLYLTDEEFVIVEKAVDQLADKISILQGYALLKDYKSVNTDMCKLSALQLKIHTLKGARIPGGYKYPEELSTLRAIHTAMKQVPLIDRSGYHTNYLKEVTERISEEENKADFLRHRPVQEGV